MAKSVIFCSSQRNAEALSKFIANLKAQAARRGVKLIIFDPGFDKDETVQRLRHLPESERLKDEVYRSTVVSKVLIHNKNIPVADVCFIFNPNGYIGHNTHAELVAAAILGKYVFALEMPILMGKWPNDLHEEPSATAYVHAELKYPGWLLERLL
jgi:hypothetical protein